MANQETPPVDTDDIPASDDQAVPQSQTGEAAVGTAFVPNKTSMVGRWILILPGYVDRRIRRRLFYALPACQPGAAPGEN